MHTQIFELADKLAYNIQKISEYDINDVQLPHMREARGLLVRAANEMMTAEAKLNLPPRGNNEGTSRDAQHPR